MTADFPPDIQALPDLGNPARLILSVGLPRLAARADEVAAAIRSFDPKRSVEFARRTATIPGAEALSVVARLAAPQRKQLLASLDARDEQSKRLADALHDIGNPGDKDSPAAALQRLAPEVDLTGEMPFQEVEEPDPHEEALRTWAHELESAPNGRDLRSTVRNMGQLGISAARAGKGEIAEAVFRRLIDHLRGTGDRVLLSRAQSNLANLLRNQPGRLAEAQSLAEEALTIQQELGSSGGETWKIYTILADILATGARADPDHEQQQRLLARAKEYADLSRSLRQSETDAWIRDSIVLLAVLGTKDEAHRRELERLLPEAELLGKRKLVDSIGRILKGERNPEVLCKDLDSESSLIVETILRGIADPSTLQDFIRELEGSAEPPAR